MPFRLVVVVLVVAAGAACASAEAAYRPVVVIDNDSFSPGALHVPTGAVVSFENQDVVAHSVTARDGAAGAGQAPRTGAFSSGTIDPGDVFVHRFTTPGHYTYVDVAHADDQAYGTVIVERPHR